MPAIRPGVLAMALLLPGAGAAEDPPPFRTCADFGKRVAALKTVGLVQPVVKAYELTASNDRVFQPEWSDQARDNVAAALEAALVARGLAVRRIDPPGPADDELREATLLYEAAVGAILEATYVFRFPAKMAHFDYALGDLRPTLGPRGVDALVFVHGVANISSGGRKTVQALSAVFAGVSSRGIDRLQLALVDGGGDVLWFDAVASTSSDLRDPGSAADLVKTATDRMPPGAP